MASTPLPEEEFVDTVDEIVAALEKDPILIQEAMGNGYTEELTEALHAMRAEATYPVYVVYTVTPSDVRGSDADEELASLVHARIGKDGIYVVHTTDGAGHVGAWGDLDPAEDRDSMLISLAQSAASREMGEVVEGHSDGRSDAAHTVDAAAAMAVAARKNIPDYSDPILSEAELEAFTDPMWARPAYVSAGDDPEPAVPGYTSMTWSLVAVVVLVCAYRLLQALGALRTAPAGSGVAKPRRDRGERRTPPPSVSEAEHARRRIESARTKARTELARLDRSLARRGDRERVGDERVELARGSHEVATELVESEDALDVVGALVLARTGTHAMDRKGDGIYRCCYINPLHGEGTTTEPVGGSLSVPVCRSCQGDLRADRKLEALIEVRRMALDKPYYTGTSVWARTGYGTLVDDLWREVREDRR